MRVLVACESSGRVRDAFLRRGHDAISCDIKPTEVEGPHHVGRAEELLGEEWDAVIAFPPCTYLSQVAVSCIDGKCFHLNCSQPVRRSLAIEAALLFRAFLDCGAPRVAVENPTPHPMARRLMGKPTCYVQPHWFGDPYIKRTNLWLRGLQPLVPTRWCEPKGKLMNNNYGIGLPPLKGISRVDRSRTPLGLADAMAEQWGHEELGTLF